MRFERTRFVACVVVGLSGLGCRAPGPADRADEPQPVRAYVVHNFPEAFDRLCDAFERETGITVERTYACRRNLYRVAKRSKRGDLYVDSQHKNIERLAADGLAAGPPVQLGALVPVIEVAKGNPKQISGLADLSRPDVRVSMGASIACMGRVARRILERNDLAGEVRVRRHVLGEDNMAKSVDGKKIDATVIWLCTVRQVRGDEVDTIPIPPPGNLIEPVEAVVMNTGRNRAGAERFMKFLDTPGARQVLSAAGLVRAP